MVYSSKTILFFHHLHWVKVVGYQGIVSLLFLGKGKEEASTDSYN